jgi:hypothetical protein
MLGDIHDDVDDNVDDDDDDAEESVGVKAVTKPILFPGVATHPPIINSTRGKKNGNSIMMGVSNVVTLIIHFVIVFLA